MAEKEIWLSQEEYDKKVKHLDWLKNERTAEIAEELKIARGFGDLSENAEYDAAKNAQAQNAIEIGDLEEELRAAKIIGKDDADTRDAETVGIGDTVKVKLNNKSFTFTIVGSAETDPVAGKISNDSPIGHALLGLKVKDKIHVETPGGLSTLQVVSIVRS